ncbi:MAG: 3-isopropylmalate dehydratase [Candidatus Aminicenantes bacterium]|nr:3-isopropylmalate dehydratase [Candidatus Aminicenantes bacterium]
MSESEWTGRLWVLKNTSGKLIEDIDTDQIYHNAYLHITEISEMGAYALGNLEGWKDFSSQAKPGDIIVAGRNFGAGSSRQQAVDCFAALKISLIIAPSFGAIYFRNAVNSGFPVLQSPGIGKLVQKGRLCSGDRIKVNIQTGKARNLSSDDSFQMKPMSDVQRQIYEAGGLFAYAQKMESG